MSSGDYGDYHKDPIERISRQHLDAISARHRLEIFNPPFAKCSCGSWRDSAPGDMLVEKARDWLLDAFLRHKKFMKKELALEIARRRATRSREPSA